MQHSAPRGRRQAVVGGRKAAGQRRGSFKSVPFTLRTCAPRRPWRRSAGCRRSPATRTASAARARTRSSRRAARTSRVPVLQPASVVCVVQLHVAHVHALVMLVEGGVAKAVRVRHISRSSFRSRRSLSECCQRLAAPALVSGAAPLGFRACGPGAFFSRPREALARK